MDAILSIQHSALSGDELHELTLSLLGSINHETELTARLLEEPSQGNTKGDEITIGQLVLVALSSGTVVALLQVLKAYLERKPTLRFEIKTADGRELKIEAEHLSPERIAQTMQVVKQLCEGDK